MPKPRTALLGSLLGRLLQLLSSLLPSVADCLGISVRAEPHGSRFAPCSAVPVQSHGDLPPARVALRDAAGFDEEILIYASRGSLLGVCSVV